MEMHFDYYEVHPVKDYGEHAKIVEHADADFWSIYGRLGDFYIAIGDYPSKIAADLIVELLNKKNCGLPPQ